MQNFEIIPLSVFAYKIINRWNKTLATKTVQIYIIKKKNNNNNNNNNINNNGDEMKLLLNEKLTVLVGFVFAKCASRYDHFHHVVDVALVTQPANNFVAITCHVNSFSTFVSLHICPIHPNRCDSSTVVDESSHGMSNCALTYRKSRGVSSIWNYHGMPEVEACANIPKIEGRVR